MDSVSVVAAAALEDILATACWAFSMVRVISISPFAALLRGKGSPAVFRAKVNRTCLKIV